MRTLELSPTAANGVMAAGGVREGAKNGRSMDSASYRRISVRSGRYGKNRRSKLARELRALGVPCTLLPRHGAHRGRQRPGVIRPEIEVLRGDHAGGGD